VSLTDCWAPIWSACFRLDEIWESLSPVPRPSCLAISPAWAKERVVINHRLAPPNRLGFIWILLAASNCSGFPNPFVTAGVPHHHSNAES